MGLDIRTAEFLLHSRTLGVDYSDMCTLGRQRVMLSTLEARRLAGWLGGIKPDGEEFGDFFFKALGAARPLAMDISDYEDADILHNLNAELPAELKNRFSCLIDGGTLEHIFDFKQALKSCMQMVKPGGHLIICQMANNCMGHGFYQLSPELFYSALAPENGYEVRFMALSESGIWYQPLPPNEVGERIQARTRDETFIYVVAQRISDVEPFINPPHQSDYVSNLAPREVRDKAKAAGAAANIKYGLALLKPLRSRVGAFKRKHLIPMFPIIGNLEDRYRRYRLGRPDRLTNPRRFRKLGQQLFNAVASIFVCSTGTQALLPVLEIPLL